MKKTILIAAMILANALFACTACKDTGKLSYFVPCEHCKGTGMVGTGSGSGITSDYRVYSINLLTGDSTLVRRSVHIKCSTVAKKCTKCSAAKTGYVRKQFPCWKCKNGPKPFKAPGAKLAGTKDINKAKAEKRESAYSLYVKDYKKHQLN